MLNLVDRMMRAFSDATLGTAIVMFHVVLADRTARRLRSASTTRASLPAGRE